MVYSDSLKGYVFVFLAAFFWANIAILGRILFKAGMSPYEVVFWRALLACLIVGAYLYLSKKGFLRGIKKGDFFYLALLGSIGVGFNYLGFIASIKYIKIATALLILYTFPSLVVVLGRIFLGERITRVKLLSLFLSMIGLVIILGGDIVFSPEGYFWALISAIGNASYALIGRKFSGKIESLKTLFWGFLFGAIFLFVVLLIAEGKVRIPTEAEFGYLLILSFFCTFLPYMFFLFSFKYLEAGKASIGALSEIPMTTFLAFLFFSEKLSLSHFLSGGLIVFSILLLIKRGG
ncbi:MAG: DMT family transporter [Synergistetes bacterium]|nr:DMT family transporter [Synergistota bacterium]MCX8127210.1 DMT family transporter [Synergistota bacterium]MDW8191904.1 DMT family transporter [Synergistota bacterium]